MCSSNWNPVFPTITNTLGSRCKEFILPLLCFKMHQIKNDKFNISICVPRCKDAPIYRINISIERPGRCWLVLVYQQIRWYSLTPVASEWIHFVPHLLSELKSPLHVIQHTLGLKWAVNVVADVLWVLSCTPPMTVSLKSSGSSSLPRRKPMESINLQGWGLTLWKFSSVGFHMARWLMWLIQTWLLQTTE